MYIIAEIGVNHDGSLQKAMRLIDEAVSCGADAVKFQNFNTDKLIVPNTSKVAYQHRGSEQMETQDSMLRRLELSEPNFVEIIKYCKSIGIDFISTPYDEQSVVFLNKNGVKTFKIASADIVDHRLLKKIAELGSKVIMSTGMATLQEIDAAVSLLKSYDCEVTILHCTSNYPCSDQSVNLRVISTLQQHYQYEIGFSDHTTDSTASIIAMVLGATIFEKHFTLDKNSPGPDHAASADPVEFEYYCRSLRRGSILLGNGKKIVFPEEQEMRSKARKSIRYSRDFEPGHKITEDDLVCLRPGDGMYPSEEEKILGKILKLKVRRFDSVKENDFG